MLRDVDLLSVGETAFQPLSQNGDSGEAPD